MKILYIALGGKGGSDKALVDLLSKLVKYDIDPLVVCGRPDLTVELEKIGVKSLVYDFTWAINPPIHSIRDKILYLPRQIKCFLKRKVDVVNLEKAVKDFSPDLISTNVGVVNLGYNLGKKMGLPHVWHIREYQDQDHGMHPVNGMNYFRRLLRKNQFNIAITKDLYQYFRMCSPAVQIYDGVRDCRSHFASCVPQKYFILQASYSKVRVWKNFSMLINRIESEGEGMIFTFLGLGTRVTLFTDGLSNILMTMDLKVQKYSDLETMSTNLWYTHLL